MILSVAQQSDIKNIYSNCQYSFIHIQIQTIQKKAQKKIVHHFGYSEYILQPNPE